MKATLLTPIERQLKQISRQHPVVFTNQKDVVTNICDVIYTANHASEDTKKAMAAVIEKASASTVSLQGQPNAIDEFVKLHISSKSRPIPQLVLCTLDKGSPARTIDSSAVFLSDQSRTVRRRVGDLLSQTPNALSTDKNVIDLQSELAMFPFCGTTHVASVVRMVNAIDKVAADTIRDIAKDHVTSVSTALRGSAAISKENYILMDVSSDIFKAMSITPLLISVAAETADGIFKTSVKHVTTADVSLFSDKLGSHCCTKNVTFLVEGDVKKSDALPAESVALIRSAVSKAGLPFSHPTGFSIAYVPASDATIALLNATSANAQNHSFTKQQMAVAGPKFMQGINDTVDTIVSTSTKASRFILPGLISSLVIHDTLKKRKKHDSGGSTDGKPLKVTDTQRTDTLSGGEATQEAEPTGDGLVDDIKRMWLAVDSSSQYNENFNK